MSELREVKELFGNDRRSTIEDSEFEGDIEDLIQREDMVVTVSDSGYIKRVPLSTYRAQNRGGKGRSGMSTKDEDFVSQVFVANTHQPTLFFSSTGIVYKLKVYKLRFSVDVLCFCNASMISFFLSGDLTEPFTA